MRATSSVSGSGWLASIVASSEFRLRVAYRKSGRLRWLSHLEVTRALERGIRRAGLPYAVTKGFSPHMKVGFGPALPVGTAGEREYVDVWLTRYLPAQDALARLGAALPVHLAPSAARYVSEKQSALTAGILVGEYDVVVEGREVDVPTIQTMLDQLMAFGQLTVVHKGKTKVFDLARSLPKEPAAREVGERTHVYVAVRMGPEGSLRPDVLLRAALEPSGRAGVVAVVTRTDTFVETEEGVWSRPV